jgi:preprotein translocase subunit SecF
VYSSVFLAPRVLVHLKSNETDVVLAERRAKARARREADKYATVPSFKEDMPVFDEDSDVVAAVDDEDDDEVRPAPTVSSPPEALGRGRTVPTTARPVGNSPASGRQQPSRQPKSKRGKK